MHRRYCSYRFPFCCADNRADSPFVVATFQIGLGAGNLLFYPCRAASSLIVMVWSLCADNRVDSPFDGATFQIGLGIGVFSLICAHCAGSAIARYGCRYQSGFTFRRCHFPDRTGCRESALVSAACCNLTCLTRIGWPGKGSCWERSLWRSR